MLEIGKEYFCFMSKVAIDFVKDRYYTENKYLFENRHKIVVTGQVTLEQFKDVSPNCFARWTQLAYILNYDKDSDIFFEAKCDKFDFSTYLAKTYDGRWISTCSNLIVIDIDNSISDKLESEFNIDMFLYLTSHDKIRAIANSGSYVVNSICEHYYQNYILTEKDTDEMDVYYQIMYILSSKHISSSVLEKFIKVDSIYVQLGIARNPNATEYILDYIAKKSDNHRIDLDIAYNDNCHTRTLQYLINKSGDYETKIRLKSIVYDRLDFQIANIVRKSPFVDELYYTTPDINDHDIKTGSELEVFQKRLHILASKTDDSDVLIGMCDNPNVHIETLRFIANREDIAGMAVSSAVISFNIISKYRKDKCDTERSQNVLLFDLIEKPHE